MVTELNEKNFEEKVLKNKKGVLVDFFATWCGPCKMMSPILDELAKEVKDVEVCKIDVDQAEDLAKEYGIMSVPCIIYFKDGKEVTRNLGMADKDSLLKLMEE